MVVSLTHTHVLTHTRTQTTNTYIVAITGLLLSLYIKTMYGIFFCDGNNTLLKWPWKYGEMPLAKHKKGGERGGTWRVMGQEKHDSVCGFCFCFCTHRWDLPSFLYSICLSFPSPSMSFFLLSLSLPLFFICQLFSLPLLSFSFSLTNFSFF